MLPWFGAQPDVFIADHYVSHIWSVNVYKNDRGCYVYFAGFQS